MMRTCDRIPLHLPPAPIRGKLWSIIRPESERGWTIEAKMNGDRVLIYKHPDGCTEVYNRHGSLYSLTRGLPRVLELSAAVDPGHCVEGEWVRSTDTLYLFDLPWAMVDGQCICLFRTPHAERRMVLELLAQRWRLPVVPNALRDFSMHYRQWQAGLPACEGVVAKRRTSKYAGSMVGRAVECADWRKYRFEWEAAALTVG